MNRDETRARLASPGGWGQVGSVDMARYAQFIEDGRRRRRRCGHGDDCPNRATHLGMANGVALTTGCEFHMRVWVRDGYARR